MGLVKGKCNVMYSLMRASGVNRTINRFVANRSLIHVLFHYEFTRASITQSRYIIHECTCLVIKVDKFGRRLKVYQP